MSDRNPKLTFKFILVGDSAVGKTCMTKMFCEQVFDEAQPQTIALEFGNRTIDINGVQVKIQLWDTAGQEIFHSITRSYFRSSVAIFAVYDISNRESFAGLQKWVDDASALVPSNAVRVIVGNKTDLLRRIVSEAEASDFAKQNGFLYYETSALSGHRIEEMFISVAHQVYQNVVDGKIDVGWSGRRDSYDGELIPIGIENESRYCSCC